MLGGCVQYHRRELHPRATLRQFSRRRLDNPPMVAFVKRYARRVPPGFPQKWNLSGLTLAAWRWSPTLAELRARLAEQKGAVTQAGLLPNPRVQLTPRYAAKVLGNPWTLGISFDIPIETAGKIQDRVRRAQAILAARGWDILQAAWRIRMSLRRALIVWNYANRVRRTKYLREQVEKDISQIVFSRFRAGATARTELLFVRLAYQRAVITAAQAASQSAIAEAKLAGVINVPTAALRQVQLDAGRVGFLPKPSQLRFSADIRLAMANRLDVYALLCRYDAAEQNLKYQIALQYPNIHLGPGYQFNRGTDRYTFGIGFALPIFDQNQGNIATAIARRQLVADQLNALESRVITQLHIDKYTYIEKYHRWQLWKALGRRQASVDALTARQLKEGLVSRLALLDARLIRLTDALYAYSARSQAELALTNIENDLQIPLTADRYLLVHGARESRAEKKRKLPKSNRVAKHE